MCIAYLINTIRQMQIGSVNQNAPCCWHFCFVLNILFHKTTRRIEVQLSFLLAVSWCSLQTKSDILHFLKCFKKLNCINLTSLSLPLTKSRTCILKKRAHTKHIIKWKHLYHASYNRISLLNVRNLMRMRQHWLHSLIIEKEIIISNHT